MVRCLKNRSCSSATRRGEGRKGARGRRREASGPRAVRGGELRARARAPGRNRGAKQRLEAAERGAEAEIKAQLAEADVRASDEKREMHKQAVRRTRCRRNEALRAPNVSAVLHGMAALEPAREVALTRDYIVHAAPAPAPARAGPDQPKPQPQPQPTEPEPEPGQSHSPIRSQSRIWI